MGSWEQRVAKQLRILHLDSIRNKILVFAVLATLIPSLSTAWLSYIQNKRSLTEKITEELKGVSFRTAREMDLWAKERLYDLRVFASSYEVSENLERGLPSAGPTRGAGRLSAYLNSVRERFPDYEELLVIDPQGRVVATSAGKPSPVSLPPDWLHDIRTDNEVVGQAYWDEGRGKTTIVFAVPIHLANGRFLGALTAKLNFRAVEEILKRSEPGNSGQLSLMSKEGQLIASSSDSSLNLMRTKVKLDADASSALFAKEATAVEYTDTQGRLVVGTFYPVPRLSWAVVAEIPSEAAYRQVARLRNLTMIMVTALLLGIGLMAYGLGLLIVRPLDRLTTGAAKVAAGDLEVDVPVVGGGEVAYLTEVFNYMVGRLREGRQALERLSATDSLTGLSNRRHLMEVIANEAHRALRSKGTFSVLMADVDHFKKYNDAFGHIEGDQVLTRVAAILRESTRTVDCAARYGGEEFLVVLPETNLEGAVEVAERIRARLASEAFPGGAITLSVGVAEFPRHGETPEAVITCADVALYQAKREGRNRVAQAS